MLNRTLSAFAFLFLLALPLSAQEGGEPLGNRVTGGGIGGYLPASGPDLNPGFGVQGLARFYNDAGAGIGGYAAGTLHGSDALDDFFYTLSFGVDLLYAPLGIVGPYLGARGLLGLWETTFDGPGGRSEDVGATGTAFGPMLGYTWHSTDRWNLSIEGAHLWWNYSDAGTEDFRLGDTDIRQRMLSLSLSLVYR